MQWYRFVSYGKVQHVYYRKFVAEAMRKAGFKGYIRNLPDSTVECVVFVYDDEEEIPRIEAILRKGSPLSEVETIDYAPIEEADVVGEGFDIRY